MWIFRSRSASRSFASGRARQAQRAGRDDRGRRLHRFEHGRDVDAPVSRGVPGQPARRLRELPLAAGAVAAAREFEFEA